MIRRPPIEEDENPERWLISYADFITLLFAFFVVMYSVSSVNEGKYKQFSSSINNAFASKANQPANTESSAKQVETVTEPPSPSNVPSESTQTELENMTALGNKIAMHLATEIKNGNARVIQNNRGLRIDIKDSILFTPGSANIIETGKSILSSVSTLLTMSRLPILIEGHTDNSPIYIQNAAFFSSWELSAVRASSVVEQFVQTGIENIRISALGYGPSQPISSNETADGQATNRHMSILVLYQSLDIDNSEGVEIKPS